MILQDNDGAGCRHTERVARSLRGKAASIKLLKLPDLPEKAFSRPQSCVVFASRTRKARVAVRYPQRRFRWRSLMFSGVGCAVDVETLS